MKSNDANKILISVLLPCRNEKEAIGLCIENARRVLNENQIIGEIVVSDSSSDGSTEIATKLADKVIEHGKAGYGLAYREAFPYCTGEIIFMADADGTYDFEEIPRFVAEINKGYDLIVGDRLSGDIRPGAMPWHHRHIGTPFLSTLFRHWFNLFLRDINCGMRAIRRDSLSRLDFQTSGMEFATEMLVLASRSGLPTKELPITYFPRLGKSKLRTFSDAKRHLFFMAKAKNHD